MSHGNRPKKQYPKKKKKIMMTEPSRKIVNLKSESLQYWSNRR